MASYITALRGRGVEQSIVITIDSRCKMTAHSSSSFWQCPGTRIGWWVFSLAAVFVVLFFINFTWASSWYPIRVSVG
jgi:hypothetical protein